MISVVERKDLHLFVDYKIGFIFSFLQYSCSTILFSERYNNVIEENWSSPRIENNCEVVYLFKTLK